MPYEVKLQVGQYKIDNTSWLDVRMTDMGAVLSVCDTDMNVRYTVMVDEGKTIFGEVQELVTEEAYAAAHPAEEEDSESEPSADDEAYGFGGYRDDPIESDEDGSGSIE